MTTLAVLSGAGLLILGLLLGRISARLRPGRRSAMTETPVLSPAPAQVPDMMRALAGVSVKPPAPTKETVPRLARDTVASFAGWLEASRRLVAAEARIAQELATLPTTRWIVDRYVTSTPRRVPFVLAGPTGIFALWPTDGAWTMNDVAMVHQIGEDTRNRLPGYEGSVCSAIVLAFDSMSPRVWVRGEDATSAWVVGIDWLIRWLDSFEPAQGLNPDDVQRMQQLAGPVWKRRGTARMPAARRHG
jgi:hypothetical protein